MSKEECIAACQRCAADCYACLDAMALKESDNQCPRCCMQCAAACDLCIKLLSFNSDQAAAAYKLCAELCDWCASQCGEHDHAHCKKCAESCRKCAESCRAMAA